VLREGSLMVDLLSEFAQQAVAPQVCGPPFRATLGLRAAR
jgi:hypothetical protein